jgi:hypothetical protein
MRALLISVLGTLALPFLLGIACGWLYPDLSATNQARVGEGLTGLANPELFNLLALVSVCVISLRVIFAGPITQQRTRFENAALYWLPGVAFGCCVPFFAGFAGFVLGHPNDPALSKLAVLAVVAFIWSAGFLFALLLPAHVGFPPHDPETKRKAYKIVFISAVAAAVWFYGVQQ